MTDQMSSPTNMPQRPERPSAPADEIDLVGAEAASDSAPYDSFPGWYSDPRGEASERFWNGRIWTDNIRGDKPVVVPAPEHRTPPYGSGVFDVNPKLVTSKTTRATAPPVGDPVVLERPEQPIGRRLVDRLPESLESSISDDPTEDRAAGASAPDPAVLASPGPVSTTTTAAAVTAGSFAPARTVDRPADLPKSPSTKRSWLVLALAGVGLFLGGLATGWFVSRDTGVSDSDVAAVSPGTTATDSGDADVGVTVAGEVVAGGSDAGNVTAADDGAVAGDVAVLVDQIDALEAELDTALAEAEAARTDAEDAQILLSEQQAALDNELQHNELLQTWFTAEVRSRSQAVWDGEVARVCGAAPAVVDADAVNYTRAMELIGTEADLVVAVQRCLDQQN